MAIEKIADYLYVSKQLDERIAKRAAQYEIKTVICNRPDDEEPGQPNFETVKEWLNKYGIENVIYMPVVMNGIDDSALEEFKETVAKSPAPILAYCRTGTRCAMMWALNQVKRGVEVNSVIKAAELANINLEPHREKLETEYQKRG
ncbi:TIGR01244 family sulfur transferase [Neisseriaceae bacterium B1]